MKKKIKIAVDAMGGENSPYKIVKGIELHNLETDNVFYNIFGDKNIIDPIINSTNLKKEKFGDLLIIKHLIQKWKLKVII